MNAEEKMSAYIERTKMSKDLKDAYRLDNDVLFWLADLAKWDKAGAVIRAFVYGKAKGYRAAKAEAKRV